MLTVSAVLWAELPCGRTVDIRTAEGALEWLSYEMPNPCCGIVQDIRRLMTQLQQQPQQQGTLLNETLMSYIAMLIALPHALAKTHSHKFSLKEIQDVVALYVQVLEQLAASDQWKQTGVLREVFHRELVGSIVPWSYMALFVKTMMPNGFTALAKLMQAPIGDVFPYPWMCETILLIVNNANISVDKLTLQEAKALGMENLLDDNFLYRLEPTGLVAQSLRALTSPTTFSVDNFMLAFVNCLIRDSKFIRKRCRPGAPLTNTLKALLDGTDGWKPQDVDGNTDNPDLPLVQRRLQLLYDTSLLDKKSLDAGIVYSCRNCNKKSSSMKKCGRCKGAMYCSMYVELLGHACMHLSKSSCIHSPHHAANSPASFSLFIYLSLSIVGLTSACQKADWSRHKKMCQTDNALRAVPLANVVKDWLKKNLLDIVQETQQMATSLGISRKDVVLEVDLKASNDPALLIKPFRDYVEGRGMPDWGCQSDMEEFIQRLKDMHSTLTDHHILVLHRSYDAEYGICRL
jgi:hypothetical protein